MALIQHPLTRMTRRAWADPKAADPKLNDHVLARRYGSRAPTVRNRRKRDSTATSTPWPIPGSHDGAPCVTDLPRRHQRHARS